MSLLVLIRVHLRWLIGDAHLCTVTGSFKRRQIVRRVVEPLLYLFILVLLGSRIHLARSTIHWAAEGESRSNRKTIRCLHLCDLL